MSEKGIKFKKDEPTKVQQHFKDETNINVIVRRFQQTGQAPVTTGQPQYLDLYNLPSFQEAQNIVIDVSQKFAALPAKIRTRFENNPEKLLEFIDNKENLDEAINLGLAKKPEPTPLDKEIMKQNLRDEAKNKRNPQKTQKEPKGDEK